MTKQKRHAVDTQPGACLQTESTACGSRRSLQHAKPGQFISMYTRQMEASCFHVRSVSVRSIKSREDFVLYIV